MKIHMFFTLAYSLPNFLDLFRPCFCLFRPFSAEKQNKLKTQIADVRIVEMIVIISVSWGLRLLLD